MQTSFTLWHRLTQAVLETGRYNECCILSLSVLTAIFQVNLGQPVFIEAKDDGGGDDNWTTGAISRAKLESNHHHQQTNIQFFYRPDALPVAQPSVSKH